MDALRGQLIVGRVRRAHGRTGALRVEVLTDFPERFRPGAQVDVAGRRYTVHARQEGSPDLVLKLEGLTGAEAAGLRGAYLTVPLTEARRLPPGRYYHYQLVGLEVHDVSGRTFGRIVEVLEYPGQDIYRAMEGTRETLIPAVRDVVREVDLATGRMLIDLPAAAEV